MSPSLFVAVSVKMEKFPKVRRAVTPLSSVKKAALSSVDRKLSVQPLQVNKFFSDLVQVTVSPFNVRLAPHLRYLIWGDLTYKRRVGVSVP